jgi:hypothetical protein
VGHQARVKNADLRHPSRTVVMQERKSASPVLNVLNNLLKYAQSVHHMRTSYPMHTKRLGTS